MVEVVGGGASAMTAKRVAERLAGLDRLGAHRNPSKPPPGWEPGYTVDNAAGEATFHGVEFTPDVDPDERRILAEMGLDPDQWCLDGDTLQVRKWQQLAGSDEWCWYFKITATRRRQSPSIEAWCHQIRRAKPRKLATANPGAQVWATSDWQIAKAGTLDEVIDRLAALPDRFEAAWRQSGKPGQVVVVFGGDLVEDCSNHYPGQTFTVELNEREQRRVVRELAHRVVDRAAGLVPSVTVAAVGGNHGEVRAAKKSILTTPGDNRDVAAIEDVRWAYRDHDRWAHVSWALPGEDLSVLLEVDGVPVCVAHGHQFGGNGADKVRRWWNEQAGNHRPAGAARLLISGHYHHLVHQWFGPRTWIQCPSEDAGSPWYAEQRGEGEARPGSVTIDVVGGEIGDVRVV